LNDSILDDCTHYKPTETFQYKHFTSCHPPGVKPGFIKGEALQLLRTNSFKTMLKHNLSKFKLRLIKRRYPKKLTRITLSEVNFATRQSALLQKNRTRKRVLPFVTTHQPSVPHLKKILTLNWDLIQNQPLLNAIFRNPPIIAYKRSTSFKDILLRAKL